MSSLVSVRSFFHFCYLYLFSHLMKSESINLCSVIMLKHIWNKRVQFIAGSTGTELTLAHRSIRRFCNCLSLTCRLVFSSPLSTGPWCRALREWYSARNSTCCLGVQKWGIRSWRGKKYLAVNRRGWQQREKGHTWSDGKIWINKGQNSNKDPTHCRTKCSFKRNINYYQSFQNALVIMNQRVTSEIGDWRFQSNLHQDKNQVVGKGRDRYHHQRNGLEHVSAKLRKQSKAAKRQ